MAISFVDLERQLKSAVKTGKVTVGRKEVANTLKGSKLVVWSGSANLSQDLLSQCQSLEIPAVRYEGNPIELGRMAGIPYKVSVLSVRTGGDAKLEPFAESKDYSAKKLPSFVSAPPAPVEEALEKEPEEGSKKAKKEPKRRAKKADEEKEEKPAQTRKTSKRAKEDSDEKEEKKPKKSSASKTKKDTDKKKPTKKKEKDDDEEE